MVLAPAMHHKMWFHQAVQANVATLVARGVRLVGPEKGALASGETGVGRMAGAEAIVGAIGGVQGDRSLEGLKVVISAGPTREPLDPVRYLGNRSSGKMGFALAAEAARRGGQVVLVAGPVSLPTPFGVRRIDVTTALEMEKEVHGEAHDADLIIMTAAVADFRPASPRETKIKKGEGVPRLELVANPDILKGLEALAPKALRVGFAAETDHVKEHALEKLGRKGAHAIIANDVSRSDIGFSSDANEVTLYRRNQEAVELSRRPKTELASALLDLLGKDLTAKAG